MRASSGRSATSARHTAPTVVPTRTSRSPPAPNRSRRAAKNRIRTRTGSPVQQLHHVAELREEELPHRELDRRRRARQRDDDLPAGDAGGGAREHRGRADLRVREHAEKLAEALEAFLEEARDRLVGGV